MELLGAIVFGRILLALDTGVIEEAVDGPESLNGLFYEPSHRLLIGDVGTLCEHVGARIHVPQGRLRILEPGSVPIHKRKCAPSCASCSAVARPRPDAAPVISTTRSENVPSFPLAASVRQMT